MRQCATAACLLLTLGLIDYLQPLQCYKLSHAPDTAGVAEIFH
jgi:hypothetical protein